MERDLVLNGVRIREYQFDPEYVYKKINDEVIKYGMNYISYGGHGSNFGKEFYINLAHYLVEHEIYADFYYHVLNNVSHSGFDDDETFKEVRKIMGKYYMVNRVGELGTKACATAKGYGPIYGKQNTSDDLNVARENFNAYVRDWIGQASRGGQVPVVADDSTNFLTYVNDNGTAYPELELCNGNPEIMIPLIRANAKALNKDFWSTYVAHEWYAGTRTLDPLKMKRLKLYYYYAYMSGSCKFQLESGDECLNAHDTDLSQTAGGSNFDTKTLPYGYDHPISQQYRQFLRDFAKFVKEDFRPKGGPKVKVAFVQGNLDGYTSWRAGSSLWNTHDDPNFGYSTPEFVWRIFDDLGVKRRWHDVHNFGEQDLSATPAYGTYDIVPAWAGYEAFSRYKYLIFTGWNTMTEEIYEDLKKFVYNGGKLLISAAHLNTSSKRTGEMKLIHDGKVSDLFGCDLDASEKLYTNDGVKFIDSLIPEVKYPASFNYDPLLSEGYVNYPKVTMTTASPAGRLSDSFWNRPLAQMPQIGIDEKDRSVEAMPVSVAENRYGKGCTILMTTLDYPSGSAYPTYRTIVRELITASHRNADIKIYGGDRLRFTVYEGNKVYLLNTDFDCRTDVIIEYNGQRTQLLLEPREFKPVQL